MLSVIDAQSILISDTITSEDVSKITKLNSSSSQVLITPPTCSPRTLRHCYSRSLDNRSGLNSFCLKICDYTLASVHIISRSKWGGVLNIKMFYDSYWVIRSGSWRIRSLCILAYTFPFYNGLLHYALWHMPASYWLSCLLTFTYAQPHPSMDLVYKGLCYIPIILTLLRQSQSLLS